MPNPRLTMITKILAKVLFRHDTNSAKITAPLTENKSWVFIDRDDGVYITMHSTNTGNKFVK